MSKVSLVDVHLEHLYPNPLRRLPSAILSEHHAQRPPCRAVQVEHHHRRSGWNHSNNFQQPNAYQGKWMKWFDSMLDFCVGTNAKILCGGSPNKETKSKKYQKPSPHHPEKIHIHGIWWVGNMQVTEKLMKIGSTDFHLSHRPFSTRGIFAGS